MNHDLPRKPFDFRAYVDEIQTKPCFLCQIAAKNPEYRHHIVYEDEFAIAFLNKYPVLYGYTPGRAEGTPGAGYGRLLD